MYRYLFFLLGLFFSLSFRAATLPSDYIWTSPSKNSSESMPCGGGSVGLNVWVEEGNVYFYICKSGCFDANNTLLKLGRFCIKLTPVLQTATGFSQVLKVNDGYVIVKDAGRVVRIWVDVFKPVIHVDVMSKKEVHVEYDFESWRYKDLPIEKKESFQTSYKFGVPRGTVTTKDNFKADSHEMLFWHQNSDSTVFDATAVQQQLGNYRSTMYNPLSKCIFGGKLTGPNLQFQETYQGDYQGTNFQGWKYQCEKTAKSHAVEIILANCQGTVADWQQQLLTVQRKINVAKDFSKTVQWWHEWWQRSFIEAEGEAAEMTRNYTLFRYMLGCNALSDWPTKFNGGLFCFDPKFVQSDFAFTPDYRRWGGGTHTAQNQRLVYWPLLKSGDYDALKAQLDFYIRILSNAELRSKVYWHHGGAAFTEQIENFGLPEYAEYGMKRPENFDPGLEYNAWLEYTWDTVLEFCQMALDAEAYGNMDISSYIPWIESSLDFFDEHYRYIAKQLGRKQVDEQGKLVIYPGSGGETFKMAYNPTSTVAGLKVVTSNLLNYLKNHQADSSIIKKYKQLLEEWPNLSFREVEGHQVIAPAVVWARVNNTEPTMLYPVFPWRLFCIGRDSLDIAVNTWKYDPYVNKFKGIVGWEQANIWAADLGLVEDAVYWNQKKLKDGPYRFPAFWGPGHDWSPDHNWGGSGMIGLQEMLVQETDDKIYLFPAWKKTNNVHFKLHCSNNVIVEAAIRDGKVVDVKVSPNCNKKVVWE